MDRRFQIIWLIVVFIICTVLSSQRGNFIICQLTKRTNASLQLKLVESSIDLFEKKSNNSIVSFLITDNNIELKFLKSSINERDLFIYFSTGFYYIPNQSEMELPDGTIKPIKAGLYKIEETDLYYEIKFD